MRNKRRFAIAYTEHKKQRDKAMFERFNHLYKIERKRLDDVWKILEDEFFLGTLQIQRRLKDYQDDYIEDDKKNQLNL